MPASSPTRASALLGLLAALLLAPAAHAQGADWPRQFDSTSGTLIVYQPQPERLDGNTVTARAAFSLRRTPAAPATFGVLWFQARVRVDRDSLTVSESNLDVTRVHLPGATAADESRYEHLVEAEAAGWDLSGSLEELRAGLAASAKERLSIDNLDHTPPKVLFEQHRALLVVFDGPPQTQPIDTTSLQRVINTPYAVVFVPAERAYYLSGANLWYRATNPLGPWSLVPAPPPAVAAVVPPDTSSSDQLAGTPPVVITATEPTELIVTDGEPVLEPLVGHELYYVSNTESDVLRDAKTQTVYVLLSGRWYAARGLDDPWVYVPADQLPEVFKQIPLESAKGHLLASVAGTDQAGDAVADAEIPQTSDIARDDREADVAWEGTPQFDPITGTDLRYGVNTDAQVVMQGDRYFLCDQGVWYVATDPNGPWVVSDTRPDGLDDVGPSCPVYNLRFVEIYDSTPDAIEFGYLPGYLGYYPCRGTVVYGTGYRYRAYRGRASYCARPTTWGFHARYNPYLSRWSFGLTYWSGFLRIGLHWESHPGHPHMRRYSPWLGPGGFHRSLIAEDRSPVRVRPTGRIRPETWTPANLYSRSDNVKRLAKPAAAPLHPRTGTGGGRSARVPNDLYAGSDGRVYQRGVDGQWRVNEGRRWLPAAMPADSVPPLVPVHGGDTGPGGTAYGGDPRPAPPPGSLPGMLPGSQTTFPGRPATTPIPAAPTAPTAPPGQKPEVSPMPVKPAPGQEVTPPRPDRNPTPVPSTPPPSTPAPDRNPTPVPSTPPPSTPAPDRNPTPMPSMPAPGGRPTPVPEPAAPVVTPPSAPGTPAPEPTPRTRPAQTPEPSRPAFTPSPSPYIAPQRRPAPSATPPVLTPSPGSLERQFRARERTGNAPQAFAPAPQRQASPPAAAPAPQRQAPPPQPARKEPPPAKPKGDEHHKDK